MEATRIRLVKKASYLGRKKDSRPESSRCGAKKGEWRHTSANPQTPFPVSPHLRCESERGKEIRVDSQIDGRCVPRQFLSGRSPHCCE